MMKFKRIRIIALMMTLLMALSSCQTPQEIPELLEPAVGGSTFRVVTKGPIGDIKYIFGTVVPTDYCHFYKKIVKIDKITVEIGQYVEAGDILAEADLESVKSQLADLNAEVNLLDLNNETSQKVYESTLKKLEYQKNWTEYLKNRGMAEDSDVQAVEKLIEEEKENHYYNDALYNYTRGKYSENIADLNEIIQDGTLRAKHSGYVTYIKNLRNGNSVGINENVVIVSDYEDTYIRTEVSKASYQYRKYEYKKALVHDKLVNFEEFDYTDSEVSFSSAQGITLTQRFKMTEENDLKVGDKVALSFRRYDKDDVIVIGKDSSYADELGTFVYVKAADGSLEKRYYEQGTNSKYEIEVVSGIEEGEYVLYEQDSPKPSGELEEYVATRKDVSQTKEIKTVKYTEENTKLYESPDKGVITNIYVAAMDEVKVGDALYEIEIDSQKGKLSEISNEIKHLKQNYDENIESNRKNREEIEKTISENKAKITELSGYLETQKERIASGNLSDAQLLEAYSLKDTYEYTINSLYSSTGYGSRGIYLLEEDLKNLEYNLEKINNEYNTKSALLQKQYSEQKKSNNGTGYKTVYAEVDGVVKSVISSTGTKVVVGDDILYTADSYDDVFWLGTTFNDMPVGYDFKVTGEKKSYEATVVGPNYQMQYIFTEKGKVYGTYSDKDTLKYFSTRVEDEDFTKEQLAEYKALIDIYHYDSFVVIPGAYVFKEEDYEKKEYFFVWKKENDDIVKYFIEKGSAKEYGLGDDSMVVVMNGVEVGDILVK